MTGGGDWGSGAGFAVGVLCNELDGRYDEDG
jgi:hypothetical protein